MSLAQKLSVKMSTQTIRLLIPKTYFVLTVKENRPLLMCFLHFDPRVTACSPGYTLIQQPFSQRYRLEDSKRNDHYQGQKNVS